MLVWGGGNIVDLFISLTMALCVNHGQGVIWCFFGEEICQDLLCNLCNILPVHEQSKALSVDSKEGQLSWLFFLATSDDSKLRVLHWIKNGHTI